ncbi:MAG: DUF3047 domain-containing protein [Gammaproteobacteria bacterium]
MIRFALLTVLLAAASASAADNYVARFSSGSLDGWENKSFREETRYRLSELDGATVLKAQSQSSASGLYKKIRIDLRRTPFLNWRWRIENRLQGLDEKTKSGDDYAARIYVVISGGWAFWRTRAVNYVWAGTSAKGEIWPNAFAGENAMMIAVRSSSDDTGRWYEEKRNILKDLKRVYGEDISSIDAVALMTDTDNSNGRATAYYGDIFFSEN